MKNHIPFFLISLCKVRSLFPICCIILTLVCSLTQAIAQTTQGKIAVGAYHSVVLDEKGDVYTFGAGVYGELGHGGDKRFDVARPIDHPALDGKTIVDISAAKSFMLFLTDEGEVYASGSNLKYAFGPQTTTFGLENIAQITHAALDTATIVSVHAGQDFSYFLSDKGTVFVTGENDNGYLGVGFTGIIDTFTPMDLVNLNGEKVVKISTSFTSRLLLTDANNLYAVGSNTNGQFGNGGTISTIRPVAIPMGYFDGKTIKDILTADGAHLVITTDGSVYTMGNHRFSLGIGAVSSDILVPTQITHPSLEGKAIASGSTTFRSIEGTLLVSTDGSVFVVGENHNGQLGKGDFVETDTSWTKIPASYFDYKEIVEAKLGETFSLFRASDGTIYGSGLNAGTGYSGALTRPLPINTSFLQGKTITKMVASDYFALLLTDDGQVFMFSTYKITLKLFNDDANQVSIFDRISIKSVPTKLTHSNLNGHTLVDVKAGAANTYLLTEEGKVFSFGKGATGTLGIGDSVDVYVPTLLSHSNLNGKKIIDIVSSGNASGNQLMASHTLLLADDGSLFAMGSNHKGQLGVGDVQSRFVPTPVTTNLAGKTIVKIAVGPLNSMAIASDGSVFLWGEGANDYMGFGNSDDLNVPTLATHANVNGKKIIDGAIGYLATTTTNSRPHFLFLNEDYDLFGMGENSDGALGLGFKNATIVTTPQSVIDTMITGDKIVQVLAGLKNSMLRTESGKLYSWGAVRTAGFNVSSIADSLKPALVMSDDVTTRKVVSVSMQQKHGLVLLDDGTVLSFGQFQSAPFPIGASGNGFLNDGIDYSDYSNQLLLTKIANFTTYNSPIPTGSLALHLDAERMGFITANDSVDTWLNLADSTQNAVHPGLGFRPLRADSAMNNRPAMRFNGTNSYFTLPTTADLGIQNNDYEVFMVAKSASSNSNVAFLLGGANNEFELKMNIGVGLRFNPKNGIWEDRSTDGAFTDGSVHLFNAWASSSEFRVAVNRNGSNQSVNGQSSYAGNLNLGIGLGYNPQYHFAGDISEIIIYNKVLSSDERNQVETYLFEKYAIQNYKNESASLTGTEGWRLLSSPVADSSYASFFRGLWTQGFTGASFEQGASNVYSWPINSGNRDSTQWTSLTNASNTFTPGQGILAYIYSDDDGPNNESNAGFPKTLRSDGLSPSADVNLNALVNPNVNGWSLVGNPFSTNVDWDVFTKTNLSGSVYVWDNSASEWKTWNGTVGGLTNGLIGPFNGFFVETLDASPELSVPLSAKVEGESVFLGKEVAKESFMIELQIQHESGKTNKTWVEFSENGLEGKDAFDAVKLVPLSFDYVQISTTDANGKQLDINQLPIEFGEIEIPLSVNSTFSGEHNLSFSGMNLPQDWKVELFDTQTGESLMGDGKLNVTPSAVSKKQTIEVNKQPEITAQTASENRFVLKVKRGTTTSIESQIPTEFGLSQNYPNPFNPSTTIQFALPKNQQVRLDVFDVTGRMVQTLVNETKTAGYHSVQFNASQLSSGLYFYRLSSKQGVVTKKLLLIK